MGACVAVIGIGGAIFFQRGTKLTAKVQIRAELERLATAAAHAIDGDLHRDLPQDVTIEDPRYQQLVAPLAAFHRSFPQLYYVYTARLQPQVNFRFVLDTATVLTGEFPDREMDPSLPGDAYDFPDPAMLECAETGRPSSSKEPVADEFGTFLTGCAPIRDSSGAINGIIGVDISMADYEASLTWTQWVLWGGIFLALFCGGAVGLLTWTIARRSARAEALAFDVLESHTGLVMRVRHDGVIIFANRAFASLLGSGDKRAMDANLGDLLHPEDAALMQAFTGVSPANGGKLEFESPLHGPDGSAKNFRWHCRAESGDDGDGAFVQIVGDDITELRAAQEKLTESEQRHRLIVEGASDIVTMMDRDGVFTYQSPSIRHVLGYVEGELVGHNVFEIVHPDDAKSIRWALSFITKGRDISGRRWRVRFRHKSGTWVLLESIGSNRLDHPAFRAIVVNSRDVTERERMIEERDRQNRLLVLSQSAARIGGVSFESATGALFWTEETYNIFEVSADRFELTLESGLSFFHGRSRLKLMAAMRRCATKGRPFDVVVPARTAKGRDVVLHCVGLPRMRGSDIAGIYGSMQDITEIHRQQQESARFDAQMRQTQRLESLGVLAGGIAHDFNNILTGILGNASLLALDVAPGHQPPRALTQIELSARRAADLCRQLVSYSGQRAVDSKPVNMDDLIGETSSLVAHTISKQAKLSIVQNASGATVLADATQIQQVIMNLVINASEALPNGEGDISVHTAIVDASTVSLAGYHLAPFEFTGKYLSIEVTDNGSGMQPDTLQRVFDPFFTTKFTGRGLGLAAVRGIVQAHRGALSVTSAPCIGSTFKVLLPLYGAPAPAKLEEPAARITHAAMSWKSDGEVLLSDDEETIRTLTRRLLKRHGFNVHSTSNGEEALETFYARDGAFTAAVLDMTMPKLGGEEVLKAIRATHPILPVLMISGYSEGAKRLEAMRDRHTAFLSKPFSASDFTKSLREVMASQPLN
ncbi:MAG TPA: PAS domain S-box protein [Opitutaceae bacterium]|nr:PAS domain S-box protein [Opitutaceae bacterium]